MTERLAVALDATAIHATSGGAGRYVRELVAHLPGAGVDPMLLVGRDDHEPWPARRRWHASRRRRARRGCCGSRRRCCASCAGGSRRLRRSCTRRTTHDARTAPRSAAGPRRHGPRRHVLLPAAGPRAGQGRAVPQGRTRGAAAADDAVIVPTGRGRCAARARDGQRPVHVVHHGVDRSRFAPAGPGQAPADDAALVRLGVRTALRPAPRGHRAAQERRRALHRHGAARRRRAGRGRRVARARRPGVAGRARTPPVPWAGGRRTLGFVTDDDAAHAPADGCARRLRVVGGGLRAPRARGAGQRRHRRDGGSWCHGRGGAGARASRGAWRCRRAPRRRWPGRCAMAAPVSLRRRSRRGRRARRPTPRCTAR